MFQGAHLLLGVPAHRDTEGEKSPPTATPQPLPPGRVSQLRHHSPCSCQGRRRNRGSGEMGSCEQSAHSTNSHTPNPRPPPPHAVPTLTELPLGLAHGPRTPGPLEQTVMDPGSKPGGTQPPSTQSLTPPACPTCPQSSRRWRRSNQAQMPGQPSNPNPIHHSLVFEPVSPPSSGIKTVSGLLCGFGVCPSIPSP